MIVLWALGFLAFHVTGGLIHLLLVLALIVIVVSAGDGSAASGVTVRRLALGGAAAANIAAAVSVVPFPQRSPLSMTLDVHIVSHTHWDREWYHPLERFRQRLVALIDELLDDPPAGGESFLLDGQAIVIDDYLDVRPERAARLAQLLRDGRLEAGPWYVLADELIPERRSARPKSARRSPSAASLRRGAAAGALLSGFVRTSGGAAGDRRRVWASAHRAVARLRRPALAGGRHGAVAVAGWRRSDRVSSAARRLRVRLASSRSTTMPRSARWSRMRDELAPRSTIGVTLIPHGADHHARPAGVSATRSTRSSASASPDRVQRSSLRAFAEQLVRTRKRSVAARRSR